MTAVFTETPSGTDRIYLDELGPISGLVYSHSCPGGAKAASFNLNVPPETRHRALTTGRRLCVVRGGRVVWRGRLDTAIPGSPWAVTALGIGTFGNDFRAVPNNDSIADGNAYNLAEVIDAAIERGLRWTRATTSPTAWTGAAADSAAKTISEACTEVAEAVGQVWQVDVDGRWTMAAAPTTVTRLLTAIDTPGGSTLDGFYSAVFLAYTDSGAGARGVRYAIDTLAEADHDHIEGFADLTADGSFTAVEAQAAVEAYVARSGYRTQFSGDLVAPAGTLLNVGGQPVDLGCETAGVRLRVLLVQPDRFGEQQPGRTVETLVAETRYDVDADVLTLTPLETTRQGLSAVL